MQLPDGVAKHFFQLDAHLLPSTKWTVFRSRRAVRGDSLALHHSLDAEQMVSIAHRDAGMHVVASHDAGHSLRRLTGIVALGPGDQTFIWHTMLEQIFPADLAF